ncbi:MAG: hypothetical protein JW839_16725 [Candidatus Lokiarchaeota archaeon]|nr:hypothetical protein [Candidatus Lokiarchaeota archaeon]
MGTYENVKDILGNEFSFRQYVKATLLGENQYKEARNQLKTLAKRGYIKRVSRNTYAKLKA